MTKQEAENATLHFGMGVSAEIWCYARDGEWAVTLDVSGARIRFYNLDDLKRTVAKMKLALEFIQATSKEDCWKECPADPFAEISEAGKQAVS